MKTKDLVVLVSCALLAGCSGISPDLGVSNGLLAPCPPSSNCVNSQATDENHTIQPFYHKGTPQEAQEGLLRAFKSEERGKLISANETYVRAEFTSSLFRFVDDVEFLVDPDAQLIHYRSASRAGYSDFGVNRRRMEQIRKALSE